jgi:hypothetical protein
MALLTLSRQEWAVVLNELDAFYGNNAPPGLRERIASLLAVTPSAWSEQVCQLELADLAAIVLVQKIVRQEQARPVIPHFLWQEQASVAEAEQIIRDHQHRAREA